MILATVSARLNSRMSEADLAHAILRAEGQPINFRRLIERVLEVKPVGGKDMGHIMAGIHTELNLDGRFIHVGEGNWGLREWMPEKAIRLNQSDDDYEN